jgi:hypothetical protein
MNADPIKRLTIRALARMGEEPMSQDVLRDTLQLGFPGLPASDYDRAVRDLEAAGYITGTMVEMLGIQWTLTAKGKLKAAQLG